MGTRGLFEVMETSPNWCVVMAAQLRGLLKKALTCPLRWVNFMVDKSHFLKTVGCGREAQVLDSDSSPGSITYQLCHLGQVTSSFFICTSGIKIIHTS